MTDPGTPSGGAADFLTAGSAGRRAGLAAGPRAVCQAVLRAFAATGGRASWDPPGAVLYVGRADCGGPAEHVTCGYLNFFVTHAAAGQWASQHPEVTGSVLDQASAEKLGVQTFGALLDGST
jgi:hypothetical protein